MRIREIGRRIIEPAPTWVNVTTVASLVPGALVTAEVAIKSEGSVPVTLAVAGITIATGAAARFSLNGVREIGRDVLEQVRRAKIRRANRRLQPPETQ